MADTTSQHQPPHPPKARKQPQRSVHHGIERVDDYAWLRADNWQQVLQDPATLPGDIRAYLEAENAWHDAFMADTQELQQALVAEMRARMPERDAGVPMPHGPYAYQFRYAEGAQHPQYVRMARQHAFPPASDAADVPKTGDVPGPGSSTNDPESLEVLLDLDREAQGKEYFDWGTVIHSPDHRLLAWTADDRGSEYHHLHIRDLATGKDIETIADTAGDVVWAADSQHLFYTRHDEHHRPRFVYRHRLGDDPANDVLVYEEPDPGFFVHLGKTSSDAFIIIQAGDHETSEVRLIDANDPLQEPRLVAARRSGVEYHVDEAHGTLYIRTNADDAEDFKIVIAPVATPSPEHWRDIVGHLPGTLILGHWLFGNHMVRLQRENALPCIVITDLATGREHEITFTEEAYALSVLPGLEFDTAMLRFTFSSPATPQQTFDYDMNTRQRILRKQQQVPSGHDPADYEVRRILAPAHDGERIPITLLWHRNTPLRGDAPLWLYGYGAYGHAVPASFSTARLSLVDRGFIFAIAHVRGGREKGQRWYLMGKREHKVNTFRDFIAAAEHLIEEGYVQPGNIIAHGGSAGGMLMGAVANMAPHLFRGIIAEVPFVDVLTTMLDASLPLTPPEWPEWGNPIESKADYLNIASYSPYDNVKAQAYPAIYALAGLTDPRVTYWEPAKWVARLRELKTDDNPLLLKTHMHAGHAGLPGRFAHLADIARIYAFALKISGRLASEAADA